MKEKKKFLLVFFIHLFERGIAKQSKNSITRLHNAHQFEKFSKKNFFKKTKIFKLFLNKKILFYLIRFKIPKFSFVTQQNEITFTPSTLWIRTSLKHDSLISVRFTLVERFVFLWCSRPKGNSLHHFSIFFFRTGHREKTTAVFQYQNFAACF